MKKITSWVLTITFLIGMGVAAQTPDQLDKDAMMQNVQNL